MMPMRAGALLHRGKGASLPIYQVLVPESTDELGCAALNMQSSHKGNTQDCSVR